MDGVHQLDDPVCPVRNAAHEIARAWPFAVVRRHPVRPGAEIRTGATDVNGAQRVIAGRVGEGADERLDHRPAQRIAPRRAVEGDAENAVRLRRGHLAVIRHR
jgi:hypothetical protein